MLQKTWLEVAHLAKACILKLAHREIFKALQLWKEHKVALIFEIQLAKDQKWKIGRLFTVNTTKSASPFKDRHPGLKEAAKRTAKRAAKASPCKTSVEDSLWVAAAKMIPTSLLITAAATTKDPLLVTSKLALKQPTVGGIHKEGRARSLQAEMWWFKFKEI